MVTLILPNGKIHAFHIPALAYQYQQAYGGTIVDQKAILLVDEPQEIGYN
jgi:hypothetical protein